VYPHTAAEPSPSRFPHQKDVQTPSVTPTLPKRYWELRHAEGRSAGSAEREARHQPLRHVAKGGAYRRVPRVIETWQRRVGRDGHHQTAS